MSIPVILFCGVTAFALILLLCVREVTALCLFFASGNALVSTLLHAPLPMACGVFVASFFVMLAVAIITSAVVDAKNKKSKKES